MLSNNSNKGVFVGLTGFNLFSYPRELVIMIALVLSGFTLVAGQIFILESLLDRNQRNSSFSNFARGVILASSSMGKVNQQCTHLMISITEYKYIVSSHPKNRFTAVLKEALKPWVHYWKLAVSRVGSGTNDVCTVHERKKKKKKNCI